MKDLLKAGAKAPAFNLPSTQGESYKLSDFKGKWVVIYFYPRDNTPGCTKESCDFSKDNAKFEKENAIILGVSPDSPASHQTFIDKQNLKITLLSDESKSMLTDYGVWQQKSMFGKKYMGVVRTTYLIDPDGKVAHVWPKVKVMGHAKDVFNIFTELQ